MHVIPDRNFMYTIPDPNSNPNSDNRNNILDIII